MLHAYVLNKSVRKQGWRSRKPGTNATLASRPVINGMRACQDSNTHSNMENSIPSLVLRTPDGAVGYLRFRPMAQCAVHALKGLACRASPIRARRGHRKHNIFSMGQKLRYPTVHVYMHTWGWNLRSR